MTNLFISLIRAFSLSVLFILALVLFSKDMVLRGQRWLKRFRKPQADPLANLKKARLPI